MPDDRFADFYRVEFKAHAIIDGMSLPISFFDISYYADHLPTAYIELPIGVNAATGARTPVEGVISGLKPFSTIEIWLNASFPDGRVSPPGTYEGLKKGSTRIFTGYVQVPGYERRSTLQGSSQGLSLNCFGKLGGLAGSTQLVRGTIVPKPSASVGLINAQAGAGKEVKTTLSDSLNNQPLETDLWEAGIKNLMQAAIGTLDAFDSFPENDFAADALKTMNVYNVLPVTALNLSNLTGPDVVKGPFRTALSNALATAFYDGWSKNSNMSTLWDALIALGGVFYFHVVPVVEEASVVAFCWNFGGPEWREIWPSDYYRWQRKGVLDQGMFTYVTRVALKSDKFAVAEFQDKTSKTTSLGVADIKPSVLGGTGQLKLEWAPDWMIPVESSGTHSIRRVTTRSGLPDAAKPDAEADDDDQPNTEEILLSSPLGNGLAKLILHDNLFYYREGFLTGRFRLDIAPGSLLKINVPASVEGDVLYGVVSESRLQGGMRGQQSYASTRFWLRAVRTKNEHETISQVEVPVHPLYIDQAYRGAPLVNLG